MATRRIVLHYTGAEVVVLPDRSTVKGPQCEHVAARALIEDGWATPEDELVFMRNGKVSLSGTVHAFASTAVSESSGSPRRVRWAPHPNTHLGPLMAAYCRAYGIVTAPETTEETVY